MDEYLFIVLAKLKADRLKLEREERLAVAGQQDLFAARSPTQHRAPKTRPNPIGLYEPEGESS